MISATILMPGSSPFHADSSRCADYVRALGLGRRGDRRCDKDAGGGTVQFIHAVYLCSKEIVNNL